MKKKLVTMFSVLASVLSLGLVACAEDTTVATITSSFTGIQTTIMEAIGAIAPVALIIAGAFLAWRYGMKFFKSVSK